MAMFPRIMLAAVAALGKIGPGAAAAVADLRPLVKHPDRDMRLAAILALGQLGPVAQDTVPGLLPM